MKHARPACMFSCLSVSIVRRNALAAWPRAVIDTHGLGARLFSFVSRCNASAPGQQAVLTLFCFVEQTASFIVCELGIAGRSAGEQTREMF